MTKFNGSKVTELRLYRASPEVAPDMLRYDLAYIRRADLRLDQYGRIPACDVLFIRTTQRHGWPTEERWLSFGEVLARLGNVATWEITAKEWVTLRHTVAYGGTSRGTDETFGNGEYGVVSLEEDWKW